MLQWPKNTSDPAYDALVLGAVAAGNFEHTFVPLTIGNGVFYVSQDALKIDGVRINASAILQQHIADMLGAYLPTVRIFDQLWAQRAETVLPCTQPATFTTEAMIKHSACIDAQLAKLPPASGIIQTVGKTWALSNKISSTVAMNIGWHIEKKIPGIPFDPAPTLPGAHMIQSPGTRHSPQHVDYCLAPETRILTTDLRWIPIRSISVGDDLIGFDEALATQSGGATACKLRRSTVQSVTYLVQPCFEIRTTRGTVIASAAHRWPVRGAARLEPGAHPKIGWRETQHVKTGDLIPHLCDPWEQDTSWDGAWMAGFLDGEGYVSGGAVGVGQNPGLLLDRAIAIFRSKGFDMSFSPSKSGCIRIHIKGKQAAMRVVGTFRPFRLMTKSTGMWEGRRAFGSYRFPVEYLHAEVLSVRSVGDRPVVGIQTSTNTFIAEGLLSHNSQIVLLVKNECTIDGQPSTFASVAQNPTLAGLVSHEGVLKILRQPGAAEMVTPPRQIASLKPAGVGTVAMMTAGAGIGAVIGGPPGALIGGAVGLATDAIRRRLG